MLSAMQALPGSEGLRNGALADWEAMSRCLNATNDCMVSGQESPAKQGRVVEGGRRLHHGDARVLPQRSSGGHL